MTDGLPQVVGAAGCYRCHDPTSRLIEPCSSRTAHLTSPHLRPVNVDERLVNTAAGCRRRLSTRYREHNIDVTCRLALSFHPPISAIAVCNHAPAPLISVRCNAAPAIIITLQLFLVCFLFSLARKVILTIFAILHIFCYSVRKEA